MPRIGFLARSIAATFLLCVAFSSASFANTLGEDRPGVGEDAPMFSGVDLEGGDFSLETYCKSGKVVVLNFWGLRCSSCIEEIGYLNPLFEKYGQKGAVFLGINVDGAQPDTIRKLMPALQNIPRYPVVPDPDFRISDLYNMMSVPLSLVIGKSGKVSYRHDDFRPGDEKGLEDALRKALSGE
jgi:peroxiredoxin